MNNIEKELLTYDELLDKKQDNETENQYMTYDMLEPSNIIADKPSMKEERNQQLFGIIRSVNILLIVIVAILAIMAIIKNIKEKNFISVIISLICSIVSLCTIKIMGNLYLQMKLYGDDVLIQGIMVLVIQIILVIITSVMSIKKN